MSSSTTSTLKGLFSPFVNRFSLVLALALACWNAYQLAGLMSKPSRPEFPEVVERLDSTAFRMVEDMEELTKINPYPEAGPSPSEQLAQVIKTYTESITPVEVATEGKEHVAEQLRQARVWMKKAENLQPRIRKETDPTRLEPLSALWRSYVLQAVVCMRMAASEIEKLPVEVVWEERAARLRDAAIGLTGFGLLTLLLLSLNVKTESPAVTKTERESWTSLACQVSTEGMIVADSIGGIRAVNPAAEKLFGRAPELLGRPLAHFLPDLPAAESTDPVRVTGRESNGSSVALDVVRHKLRRGNKPAMLVLFRQPAPPPAASAPAAVPVPAPAPKAAPSLAESLLVADLFRLCPAPLCVFDIHGAVVHFNRACAQLIDWNPNDVRDRPYWDIFLDQDQSDAARREWGVVLQSKSGSIVDQVWHTPGDRSVPMRWSRSVIRDGSNAPVYVLMIGAAGAARAARAA